MSRAACVLVTGAAGFIGSTLVERLLADGRRVVGMDSFDPFYPQVQKRRNLLTAESHRDFRLIEGDVRDPVAVRRAFEAGPCDSVVHLAALAGVRPSLERPAEYADVNVRGTCVLFEEACRHGAPRVVFASSSSVYGEQGGGAAFREDEAAAAPVSPYAATKRAGELVAHAFHAARGLPVVCARIFTAYGPRQRPDLAIRRFAERMLRGDSVQVFGDGTALRDFTYVDDLVAGLCAALDADLGYALLNFGAGRTIAVSQVIEVLERVLGVKARIEWLPAQAGDVSRTLADISAARRTVGYAPRMPFEEGVGRFADWLREAA
ncbi:MAG TPA: NAD-dependent epimerase/dehydratase family protein [Myxococcota bacterium]|nr:NAD-dependent epimerase/dehydratase family protein [Myxococcota bacterium]